MKIAQIFGIICLNITNHENIMALDPKTEGIQPDASSDLKSNLSALLHSFFKNHPTFNGNPNCKAMEKKQFPPDDYDRSPKT